MSSTCVCVVVDLSTEGGSMNVVISSPRFPIVLVMNFIAGADPYGSVELSLPARRFSTRREIIIEVISWLKDAPIGLRSVSASYSNYFKINEAKT